MVSEILAYAKGQANRLRLTPSEFDVADVIREAMTINESLVVKRAIVFHTETEPHVPPMYADREKIVHVLNNLLGNALEFTPVGAGEGLDSRATYDVERGEPAHIIEVGDTGIGIAPEHFELIFQEFSQGRYVPRRGSIHGTGLGLTIASAAGRAAWWTALARRECVSWVRVTRFFFSIPTLTDGSGAHPPR